jgi:hypothetical protein
MKKIFNFLSQILLMILLSLTQLSGQSTTIFALSPSTFYLVEPETNCSYTTINSIPSGSINIQYKWSSEEGIVASGGSSTLSGYVVKWNNSNNAKKVKVELSYQAPKKDANGNDIPNQYENSVTKQDEKTVTVKYIGNVNSIFINGNETGNGGSQVLGCSTNNVTISSSIPDTNPSVSLVYSWTFPSGWSPGTTTTTTNSVSVTPNLNGGGNISVSVRRSDGSTTKSASISVSRPTVNSTLFPLITDFGTANGTLTGSKLLCSSTNFTNSTLDNAQEYRWVATGGILVGGSSSATVTGTTSPTISATSDGTISVQAYSNVCQGGSAASPYTILYGTPNTSSATRNGEAFNGSATICKNTSQLMIATNNHATGISWSILNGSNANLYVQSSTSATINPSSSGFINLGVTASNCFGNNTTTLYFIVNDCGGFRMASNPATTTVTLIKSDNSDEVDDSTPEKISFLNAKGVELKTANVKEMIKKKQLKDGNKIEFDVSELARGDYYLHTYTPNHPDKEKRLEKLRVILQ